MWKSRQTGAAVAAFEASERDGQDSESGSAVPSLIAVGGSIGLAALTWAFLGSVIALGMLIVCLIVSCYVHRVWPGARLIVAAVAFLLAMAIFFGDAASLPSWLSHNEIGHG
jgi:hypothetical protein